MAVLMLLLFVAVTGFALLVLADSGMRMWQAFATLRPAPARTATPALAGLRQPGRVTTRVSYARGSAPRLRAAA